MDVDIRILILEKYIEDLNERRKDLVSTSPLYSLIEIELIKAKSEIEVLKTIQNNRLKLNLPIHKR